MNSFTEKNGLPRIHPHMFRHTSVSLQLQAGISIADAAKRAGHARPDVTHTHSKRMICIAVKL
ncbi:MAG: hypothetical protein IKH96_11535 [Ruminococcus sp.]|nr:hypothetical protein [Ruminococcus sp.]